MDVLTAGVLTATGSGPAILLGLSIIAALYAGLKAIPKMLHTTQKFMNAIDGFVGVDGQPGVVATLVMTNDRLDAVEQQLNGGGVITPALARLETIAGEHSVSLDRVTLLAEQARLAAADAHDEARELGVRQVESTELAMVQRGLIDQNIAEQGERISAETSASIRGFARLLAEHGGPDLTEHVAPHTHEVSEPLPTGENDA